MQYAIVLYFEVENDVPSTKAVLPVFAEQVLRKSLDPLTQDQVFTLASLRFSTVEYLVTVVNGRKYNAYAVSFAVVIQGLSDTLIQSMLAQAIYLSQHREEYELFALVDRSIISI